MDHAAVVVMQSNPALNGMPGAEDLRDNAHIRLATETPNPVQADHRNRDCGPSRDDCPQNLIERFAEQEANLTRKMQLPDELIEQLGQGVAYSFSDWPNPAVSAFGAGVYTIWHHDGRFIYVGMSGRGIGLDTPRRNTPQGLYTRLQSHASGRRSGDQFCVYVADRLVLPTLSQEDIRAIAAGRHPMDAFVRRYIHDNLSYRFAMLPDGATAFEIEAKIKSGSWTYGPPFLNPGR